MGASSSKDSDSFQNSSAGSSATLKGVRDHIIVGLSKKDGTFEYDSSLEEYMNDQMKVVRVTGYLDPMKAGGYGFGHEFLVVDLRTPEDCQLLIRAEKQFIGLNHEKYPAGGLTKVTRIDDPPKFARENKDGAKYAIVLRGGGVKILMEDFINVPRACDGRYSLWKHNCWRYAYETLRNMLNEFANLADTSDDVKNQIREVLGEMPRPSLPAEILVEAILFFCGSVLGSVAFFYCVKVGANALFKYKLRRFEMALASRTTVAHFSVASAAVGLMEKRAWDDLRALIFAICGFGIGGILVTQVALMWENHSAVPRQRDENSLEF